MGKKLRAAWEWIKDHPVMAWQVTAALISLAGSFGFELSMEQTSAVFVLFQVLAGLTGQQLVMPMRKLRRNGPTPTELDPRLLRGERRSRK